MYIGELENKQLVSIALMIIFAMAAMFLIGYKLAYDKAITYANEQINEKVGEFKAEYGFSQELQNPDYLLGNMEMTDLVIKDE